MVFHSMESITIIHKPNLLHQAKPMLFRKKIVRPATDVHQRAEGFGTLPPNQAHISRSGDRLRRRIRGLRKFRELLFSLLGPTPQSRCSQVDLVPGGCEYGRSCRAMAKAPAPQGFASNADDSYAQIAFPPVTQENPSQPPGAISLSGHFGAGKSTVARILERELKRKRVAAILLEGDDLRNTSAGKRGCTRQQTRLEFQTCNTGGSRSDRIISQRGN